MFNLKGQVTMFVIIGIVLVIIIGFTLYERDIYYKQALQKNFEQTPDKESSVSGRYTVFGSNCTEIMNNAPMNYEGEKALHLFCVNSCSDKGLVYVGEISCNVEDELTCGCDSVIN